MNEKKIYKKRMVVQCLSYVAIGGIGYLIGKRIQGQIWNDRLNYMARTGTTISNVVDGKNFVCSVTQKL